MTPADGHAAPSGAFQSIDIRRSRSSFDGLRLFGRFCTWTPLLWMAGALTPCAVLMVLRMVVAKWPRGVAINLVVGSWLSVAVLQAITSILQSVWTGRFLGELRNLASFAVIGWVFGALIIAAGSAHRLAGQATVRAVSHLGLYVLLLSIVAFALQAIGLPQEFDSTPLGLLLPKSPSVEFYTSVHFFGIEDTLGEQATRLVLFFPWYTALGLGCLSITFISALDRSLKWRLAGILGGTIGVVFSWSRIAIACLLLVAALAAFARLSRLLKIIAVGVVLAGCYGALLEGFNPLEGGASVQAQVNGARPGSNEARDLIYRLSWEGFLQSPYFGNGLDFPRALKSEPIAIGSHSTIYGLLYTGGLPTLVAFLVALAMTFLTLIHRYVTLEPGRPERTHVLVGLALTLCLALYCKFEALYSLTLPCIVLFAWLGACLPTPPSPAVNGDRLT